MRPRNKPSDATARTASPSLTTLQAWLDAYAEAWQSAEVEAVNRLFNPDAVYAETPFGAPLRGIAEIRSYWSEIAPTQTDIEVRCEALAVDGDLGVAHWLARYRSRTGGAWVRLDGVFVLRFDEQGRCCELREWWHRDESA